MDGVGAASEDSDKREDSEVKDSLTVCDMKAPAMDLNLQFYQGKLVSQPHGATVDEILLWFDDFYKLETYHGYIQWLFPTSQPSSSNRYAQPLQPEEAEAIQQDKMARKRYVSAYLMMINFYGLTIKDFGTGEILRNTHYKDRFVNLNCSTHNHIRITRILKSLGEMGLERYQFPLAKFLLEEAVMFGTLLDAIPSARDFWIEEVKDASEKSILKEYAVTLAKNTLDSVAPHASVGNAPCNCQSCAALGEIRKIVPDYKPKARAKSYISNDLEHLSAQRVVLIEDLSHLTLELGEISARLNVVTAHRAQQKTIETPAQIEELACLMDELKEVSIALGSVSFKLQALALGEIFIQKTTSRVPVKSLAAQSAKGCSEEEACSAAVEPLQDPTPEKKVVQVNMESHQATQDSDRKVEDVKRRLTHQGFSSATKETAGLKGLSTIKDDSPGRGKDQYNSVSSGAGNPMSAAKMKSSLSKESAKKELQASPKKNPEPIEKDRIILMTERLFSDFNSGLDPPEFAQGTRKENSSKPKSVLSPNIDDQDIKQKSFAGSSGTLWTPVGEDGEDEPRFESQRPKVRWSDQNPSMPRSWERLDLGGKKDEDDQMKMYEDCEVIDDKEAGLAGDAQESEEALEEPSWMKAFRQRNGQNKAAPTYKEQ